jgi:hypothetical protein
MKKYTYKRVAEKPLYSMKTNRIRTVSRSNIDFEGTTFAQKSEKMNALDAICQKFYEENKEVIEKAGFDPDTIVITIK